MILWTKYYRMTIHVKALESRTVSRGAVHRAGLTFKSVDAIARCGHSPECSSSNTLRGPVCFVNISQTEVKECY